MQLFSRLQTIALYVLFNVLLVVQFSLSPVVRILLISDAHLGFILLVESYFKITWATTLVLLTFYYFHFLSNLIVVEGVLRNCDWSNSSVLFNYEHHGFYSLSVSRLSTSCWVFLMLPSLASSCKAK